MSRSHEVDEFLREIDREGWSHSITKGNHYRLTHRATGAFAFMAFTPSDWRWRKNARRNMRLALTQNLRRQLTGTIAKANMN